MANESSPGYIEAVGSTRRKTKEDLLIDNLIPSEILAQAGDGGIKNLLKRYYEFMNMDEFIYTQNETFTDIVIDGQAQFRVSDPKNENDEFFIDHVFANSTLKTAALVTLPGEDEPLPIGSLITTSKVTDENGTVTTTPIGDEAVTISNGNELPGSLANQVDPIGKTYTITGLEDYNNIPLTFTTPIKYWVGPGPSYVLNAIEEAMDIDQNSTNYLDLMQKEIAQAIPRSLTTDKRKLYKRIIDFYKVRGSQDSIEIFFRLLFDDTVEVEYPWDNTLRPSAGDWSPAVNQFVSTTGMVSEKKNRIHDSNRYQKYSYLVRTGQNVDTWKNVFDRLVHPAGFVFFGEILLLLNLLRSANGDNTKNTTYVYTGLVSTGYGGQVFDPPLFKHGRAAFNTVANFGNTTTDALEASKVGATLQQDGQVFQTINAYSRAGRLTLSSMPGQQPGVIGVEDIPLLVDMFVSQFLPEAKAKVHRNAILSIALNNGAVSNIEVVSKGYGYSSVPAITITGQTGHSGTAAQATAVLNSEGEVESVTINNAGSGYTEAAVAIAGNGNTGKISRINLTGLAPKTYRRPPNIVLGAPTAVDQDGNLLSTNVQATAKFVLEQTSVNDVQMDNRGSGYTSIPTVTFSSPSSGAPAKGFAVLNNEGKVDGIRIYDGGNGYTEPPTITISGGGGSGATGIVFLKASEISSINITNIGNGYVTDPRVTLGSTAVSEKRARDTLMYLILHLNHVDRLQNNYFNKKGNTYYNSSMKFAKNQRIDLFSDHIIENNYKTVINSYNTSSFIEID